VIGAVATVVGVVARQLFALRENEILLSTDSMTGLANRVEMGKALRQALARASRDRLRVAVLLIDLNGFKEVNDTYGHDAGDRVLVAFGRVLRESVRVMCIPARLGGDEFAVVVDQLDSAAGAVAVAERILAKAALERPLTGIPIGIRASIGIALSTPGQEKDFDTAAEDLLRRSDAMMYRAKQTGGDSWCVEEGEEVAPPRASPVRP